MKYIYIYIYIYISYSFVPPGQYSFGAAWSADSLPPLAIESSEGGMFAIIFRACSTAYYYYYYYYYYY